MTKNWFFVTICVADRHNIFGEIDIGNVENGNAVMKNGNGMMKNGNGMMENGDGMVMKNGGGMVMKNGEINSPLPNLRLLDAQNGQYMGWLNDIGRMVQDVWESLPNIFEHIVLDEYVIMPNHFHGIIGFDDIPRRIKDQKNVNLGQIIGYFKAYTQKIIREKISVEDGLSIQSIKQKNIHSASQTNIHKTPTRKRIVHFNYHKMWQKSFYDHIIHSQNDLIRIQAYIKNNPLQRKKDLFYIK